MKTWFAALVLIVLPVAAPAQTVTIARGEAVTLSQDDGGVWGVDNRGPEAIAPFEAAHAEKFRRGDFDDAVGPNGKVTADTTNPTPARSKIKLHFVRPDGGDHSMLVIENGYDRGMVYRARMRTGGKTEPTDVCLVMPGRFGFEYWPYPIDALELSDIRLVPWQDGNPIRCE